MRRQLFGILLDVLFLVASVGNGGGVADGIRTVAVIVAAGVGAVIVFVAAVFAVGILAQRQPPYPMEPGVWP
jgi:hypothetical protein